jgi:hypothetical protein
MTLRGSGYLGMLRPANARQQRLGLAHQRNLAGQRI